MSEYLEPRGDQPSLATQLETTAGILAAEPATLLRLAELFERHGHPKTAALLRHCADRVMATPETRPAAEVIPLSRWQRSDGRHSVIVNMDARLARELVLGARYELRPLPAAPARGAQ